MSRHRPGLTAPQSAVLTFLIADVRGYTAFTRSAGDEAAARLAAGFAEIAREGVEAFGGEVIELRGDEALAVFASSRNALRAAVELQQVFADEIALHPEDPLRVGIGLDAGEAVAVENGYRGAALNMAARLCSAAGAGEVIASASVVHLAGSTDDLEVRPRPGLSLKGLESSVDAFDVSAPVSTGPAGAGDTIELVRPVDLSGDLPAELDPIMPIVGRDTDVRAVRWAWRRARRNTSATILISGGRGVGKTRLAAEATAVAAADGYPVRYVSASWDSPAIEAALAEAAASGGAAVLVLDDLDAGSAAAIRALRSLQRPGGGRSGLSILIGSDDLDPEVNRTIRRLVDDSTTIRLAPLGDQAIAEIFATYGASESDALDVRSMATSSDGLPGRIHALAAEWARQGAVRRLGGATSRAAAGRRDLRRYEAEVASNLVELQFARERTLALTAEAAGSSRDETCPFMGLTSFDVGDSTLFFGRERLVADMVSRLAGASFLGIVGPSGSGKSSALRAGLLAALTTGALPGSERWIPVVIRPGVEPSRELDRGIFAALDAEQRRALPVGADALDGALSILAGKTTLLIAVDQFEEVFTATVDPARRQRFLDELLRASGSGRAIVILALRADFYGRCAEDANLAEALAANHLLVGPMSSEEYLRAIEGPARRAGIRIEPGLAEQIVADVIDQPGGLPLLSTAMVELWEGRDGRTIRRARYEETGGVKSAVARLAEAAWDRLDSTQQRIARTIFLRLVGGGEGDAVVRRRVPTAELDAATNDEVRRTLAVLTDARLLTVGEGNVEVAHEALLREWPRLAAWIEEDREGRRLRGHLAEASREWVDAGRDIGELYRGARLAAALDWSASHTLELNELEREFVTESRALSEREADRQARSNRRLRLLLGGTAVGLAVAIGAGTLAFVQRDAADKATANANAQRAAADQEKARAEQAAVAADAQRLGAQALATKDLDLSLLLARQGFALDDSPATRADLLADLSRSPAAIHVLRPLSGRPQDVSASDDGRTLVVNNNNGEFAVIDGATATMRYTAKSSVNGVDGQAGATPDGHVWLVHFSNPITIDELDGSSGRRIRTITFPLKNAFSFGFTPDLRQLAYVPPDAESMDVFDSQTGRKIRDLRAPAGYSFINVNGYEGGHWLTSDIIGKPPPDFPTADRTGGTLAWWGPHGSRPIVVYRVAHSTASYQLSRDGTELAVDNVPEDGHETVVDLRTGKGRPLQGQHTAGIVGSGFSADGSILVTGGDDQVAREWDVASGRLIATFEGHNGRVFGPVVTDVGGNLSAWTVSLDGSMMEWDLGGRRRLAQSFQASAGTQNVAPIFDTGTRVASSPDGRLLAVGETGGAVILDATTHAVVRRLSHAGEGAPTAVAWSPDGTRLAVTGEGSDIVDLYETSTWQPVAPLTGPLPDRAARPDEAPDGPNPDRRPNSSEDVTFSADSSRVTAGLADGSIWSWDARTGSVIGSPIRVDGPVDGVALDPVTGWIAAAYDRVSGQNSGGYAAVFAPGDTQPRYTANVDDGYGHADAVAFSPDGKDLATGGGTGDVRLFDASNGAPIGGHMQANAGWVLSIAWTSDGKQLVTAGTDGTVRIIDVATGSVGGTFPGLTNQHVYATLLPDDRHVVGTYDGGQGYEWSTEPTDWASFACAVAGRSFTQAEWEQYLPDRPYAPACTP